MLKYRILTAVILIPLFLALLFWLPPVGFLILTTLLVLWGAFEWSSFLGITSTRHRFWYPAIILFLMIGLMLFLISGSMYMPLDYIFYPVVAWWLLAFVLIALYPRASEIWGKSMVLRAIMGAFVLIPCWLALNYIRSAENGIFILLYLFVLIWGADIGAYFAGRKWGKRKLAPLVSPGKSWEGLAGALVVTSLLAIAALIGLEKPLVIWPASILLAICTVLFSVVGDLFESMLKRNVGLKDSGRALPGHGGILDRIDSLTAAAPVFAVGAMLMGKIYG